MRWHIASYDLADIFHNPAREDLTRSEQEGSTVATDGKAGWI
jgi:hypothetical protein